MAFKLDKRDRKRRDEIVERLLASREKLEVAISDYNDAIEKAQTDLEEHIDDYNLILDDAIGLVDDVVSQAESDMEERSEKWQESDRGQAVQTWIDAIREIDLEAIKIDFPDPIEMAEEELSHADQISDMPDEPEY